VAAVVTEGWRSDRFQLSNGTYQGCSGSTSLFTVAFNLLLDAITTPPLRALGFKPAPDADPLTSLAYADDLSPVTVELFEAQTVVDQFVQTLEWTGSMRLKPEKCRAIALRRLSNAVHTGTTGTPILAIRPEADHLWSARQVHW